MTNTIGHWINNEAYPGTSGNTSPVTNPASGEVDYDAVFAALAAVEFDGVISSCVFGYEEDARAISERQRDKAVALIDKHFGADAGAALLPSSNH